MQDPRYKHDYLDRFPKPLAMRIRMMIKVTNIQKHEIVDTRAQNSWVQDPRYKHEYLDKFPKPLAMPMFLKVIHPKKD